MERHPLIQPMRAFLLGTLGMILAAWNIELGIICLASGFGWWKGCGCCGATSPCGNCSSGTQNTTSIQLDVAGVTDFICTDCDTNLNGTFILNFLVLCLYTYDLTHGACDSNCNFGAQWQSDGSIIIHILDGGDGNAADAKAQSSAVSTPRDCSSATGLSGLALVVVDGFNPPDNTSRCTYTGATVTVTP